MGHLRLTDVPKDQFHGCELLSFNPTRSWFVAWHCLTTRILAVRGGVYRQSFDRRRVVAEGADKTAAH